SFQMHSVARRHVQYRDGLWHDRGTLVPEMGIQRSAVEESRALSEMVAALARGQIQNAYAGGSRSARLPARRFKWVRSVHHPSNPESAVEDVVLPGRRSLGA